MGIQLQLLLAYNTHNALTGKPVCLIFPRYNYLHVYIFMFLKTLQAEAGDGGRKKASQCEHGFDYQIEP